MTMQHLYEYRHPIINNNLLPGGDPNSAPKFPTLESWYNAVNDYEFQSRCPIILKNSHKNKHFTFACHLKECHFKILLSYCGHQRDDNVIRSPSNTIAGLNDNGSIDTNSNNNSNIHSSIDHHNDNQNIASSLLTEKTENIEEIHKGSAEPETDTLLNVNNNHNKNTQPSEAKDDESRKYIPNAEVDVELAAAVAKTALESSNVNADVNSTELNKSNGDFPSNDSTDNRLTTENKNETTANKNGDANNNTNVNDNDNNNNSANIISQGFNPFSNEAIMDSQRSQRSKEQILGPFVVTKMEIYHTHPLEANLTLDQFVLTKIPRILQNDLDFDQTLEELYSSGNHNEVTKFRVSQFVEESGIVDIIKARYGLAHEYFTKRYCSLIARRVTTYKARFVLKMKRNGTYNMDPNTVVKHRNSANNTIVTSIYSNPTQRLLNTGQNRAINTIVRNNNNNSNNNPNKDNSLPVSVTDVINSGNQDKGQQQQQEQRDSTTPADITSERGPRPNDLLHHDIINSSSKHANMDDVSNKNITEITTSNDKEKSPEQVVDKNRDTNKETTATIANVNETRDNRNNNNNNNIDNELESLTTQEERNIERLKQYQRESSQSERQYRYPTLADIEMEAVTSAQHAINESLSLKRTLGEDDVNVVGHAQNAGIEDRNKRHKPNTVALTTAGATTTSLEDHSALSTLEELPDDKLPHDVAEQLRLLSSHFKDVDNNHPLNHGNNDDEGHDHDNNDEEEVEDVDADLVRVINAAAAAAAAAHGGDDVSLEHITAEPSPHLTTTTTNTTNTTTTTTNTTERNLLVIDSYTKNTSETHDDINKSKESHALDENENIQPELRDQ
ncbi:uncharacterized protein NDAI_0H02280 [Naumovozyma dairenensis CBS 421]|uniref:Uncharacterized protein n=1 Tax=Naumovozyma dairenensis (strain ATCC 10597 / BCRC 20456 / CBS 421 / NBRC 0211 / NRRL Y-12639) TaxID=1071378 RepID=G0WF41_NAUDC|nr:hypothetical protein NDAI_0H02280 [Naumovozyma dairenensis CBS 421]CCD26402.1 hypothetical protein NDAI_0H02280 [Naumovozyma dairenensis CBS 421]